MLLEDTSDDDIETNNLCICYDIINKKSYREYLQDLSNYNFINNNIYTLQIFIYKSINNLINTSNNKYKLSYYKYNNKFYLEFINNIDIPFINGVFQFNLYLNNNKFKQFILNYKTHFFSYNTDIIKILYLNYEIYIFVSKYKNENNKTKHSKFYIYKLLFHFIN